MTNDKERKTRHYKVQHITELHGTRLEQTLLVVNKHRQQLGTFLM